jgi:Fic family protein
MPAELKPEEAWCAIKFSRMGQMRELPISLYSEPSRMRFWTPPRHQHWLHRIDQQAGGNIGTVSGNALPDDNERYLINSLMEEAIASSRLEGAVSTREKAKKMLRTKRKPRNVSEQMILNNYIAIREIRGLTDEKLTPDILLHLQGILTHGTLDDPDAIGRFRTRNDVQVVETMTDEVMHDPPDASTIGWRLEQLCEFANGKSAKSEDFIHPVIKAIVLHFAIGFIHPFVDGNGRTARALFYWYMLKCKYWLFEYLPLSRILIREPIQYEKGYLYAELDDGDVTYFIHFHLRLIIQSLSALHGYIDRQLRDLKEASKILHAYPGLNHRQANLIQDCLRHPGKSYTIRQHIGTHRVSYGTARSDLLELVDRKLLTGEKRGKTYVFSAPEDLMSRIRCTPKAKLIGEKESEAFNNQGGPPTLFDTLGE